MDFSKDILNEGKSLRSFMILVEGSLSCPRLGSNDFL